MSFYTLIKKKINFSSYIRKFWMEQLQSQIWLTASSHMVKYLSISSYIRNPFLINDFATAPFWMSLYNMRKIWYSFLPVQRSAIALCRPILTFAIIEVPQWHFYNSTYETIGNINKAIDTFEHSSQWNIQKKQFHSSSAPDQKTTQKITIQLRQQHKARL